jgi:hypothetical protein
MAKSTPHKRFFPPKRNFRSLSIHHLLQAREIYHPHLAHLENVIATAVGLYRIRTVDPDAKKPLKHYQRLQKHKGETPRTLSNTVVKPWSWPALLIFVKEWWTPQDLSKQDPDLVVPRYLYLPDGTVVPTCVILAEVQDASPPPLQELKFPSGMVGGGYPIFIRVQGKEHVGSLGCLVTDGEAVYALTNHHVAGQPGQEVFSSVEGEWQSLGTSSRISLSKKLFQEVFQDWPGERVYSNVDAGLIYLQDLEGWTAQIFGIGELDIPADLNTNTISLDLIGCPVRGFGAASGEMLGEIQALFYRYKAMGGYEYVSDVLIGPRDAKTPLKTHPGDSGTIWVYDHELSLAKARMQNTAGTRARRYRPLALQWGGHVLLEGATEVKFQYALATFVSTICRELDVEIVRNWNIGHREYWGKTGHYKIAAKACELVQDAKLRKLLLANVDVIAFGDQEIADGTLRSIDPKQFVPLADVADLVWRYSRHADSSNHFADMDQEGAGEFAGQTLLTLCRQETNIDVDLWNRFYQSLGTKDKDRGALPFRVWEIYKQMVEFVKSGELDKFICAGGVMSHYVGDACQPLHISQFHHGRPEFPDEEAVHSKYETQMLDRFAAEIVAGVNQALKDTTVGPAAAKGGHAAAAATVRLMRHVFETLPPLTIIEAYNQSRNQRLDYKKMFAALEKKTYSCLAAGCITLAELWATAWEEGGGAVIEDEKLAAIPRSVLQDLYNNRDFLPAFRLTDEALKKYLQ